MNTMSQGLKSNLINKCLYTASEPIWRPSVEVEQELYRYLQEVSYALRYKCIAIPAPVPVPDAMTRKLSEIDRLLCASSLFSPSGCLAAASCVLWQSPLARIEEGHAWAGPTVSRILGTQWSPVSKEDPSSPNRILSMSFRRHVFPTLRAEDLSFKHFKHAMRTEPRTAVSRVYEDIADGAEPTVVAAQITPSTSLQVCLQVQLSKLWVGARIASLLHHLTVLTAILNVAVYPALLAFGGDTIPYSAWFTALLVLDAVLWLELLGRLCTPLTGAEGQLIYSRRAVVRHHLLSMRFAYDALCRMPYDLLLILTVGGGPAVGYGHLARLFLAPEALSIINDPFGRQKLDGMPVFVTPSRRLITLLVGSLLGVHWYACLMWHVAESLEVSSNETTWLSTVGASGSPSWQAWPQWARYVRALQHSMRKLIGEGDVGPTHEEAALELIGHLIGTLWLTYFTSKMVSLVATLNQSSERALEKIATVKSFCQEAKLKPALQERVTRHLEHVLLVRKVSTDWPTVLQELSEPLRAEVSLQRCKTFLMNPKFIGIIGINKGSGMAHPQVIKRLVEKMVLVMFSPGDFAMEERDIGNEIYFLTAGSVAVIVRKAHVATLYSGDCFGEIALLIRGVVRTASVVALTFCEAHKLSRTDFEYCLEDFPDMQERMKKLADIRYSEIKREASEVVPSEGRTSELPAPTLKRSKTAKVQLPDFNPSGTQGRQSFEASDRQRRWTHCNTTLRTSSVFDEVAREAAREAAGARADGETAGGESGAETDDVDDMHLAAALRLKRTPTVAKSAPPVGPAPLPPHALPPVQRPVPVLAQGDLEA